MLSAIVLSNNFFWRFGLLFAATMRPQHSSSDVAILIHQKKALASDQYDQRCILAHVATYVGIVAIFFL